MSAGPKLEWKNLVVSVQSCSRSCTGGAGGWCFLPSCVMGQFLLCCFKTGILVVTELLFIVDDLT